MERVLRSISDINPVSTPALNRILRPKTVGLVFLGIEDGDRHMAVFYFPGEKVEVTGPIFWNSIRGEFDAVVEVPGNGYMLVNIS